MVLRALALFLLLSPLFVLVLVVVVVVIGGQNKATRQIDSSLDAYLLCLSLYHVPVLLLARGVMSCCCCVDLFTGDTESEWVG